MAYRHDDALHKHRVRELKYRKFTFFTIAVFLLVVTVIIGDLVYSKFTESSVKSSVSNSTVQSATVNIFRTPYFQFQADESWSEVVESSKENKFVYISKNGSLVEHQLTVIVDSDEIEKFSATRILPVEVIKGRLSKVSDIDKHCNSELPEAERLGERIVTVSQVTFKCNLDSNVYRVFVGVIGGTNEISAIRPNGETSVYSIIYDDLRYLPGKNQINTIIDTFQIR